MWCSGSSLAGGFCKDGTVERKAVSGESVIQPQGEVTRMWTDVLLQERWHFEIDLVWALKVSLA